MDKGKTQLHDRLRTTYAGSNYKFLVKHIKYKDTRRSNLVWLHFFHIKDVSQQRI